MNKLNKEEGIMSELSLMKRIENTSASNTADKNAQKLGMSGVEKVPSGMAKKDSSMTRKKKNGEGQTQWKKTSGRLHRAKKETELEFTRRLLAENPRGLKGLAYVLLQI